MDNTDEQSLLAVASEAAREVGELLRENYEGELKVDDLRQYDIKLEIDRRAQDLITRRILRTFPSHGILGEEGSDLKADEELRWIIDPIDGTVNFFYGIPHFCVSIAVGIGLDLSVGVIYDPLRDEMWTASKSGVALLNGKEICVSSHAKLAQSIITVGCSKTEEGMLVGVERFAIAAKSARKIRMMGSAALAMAYIACGRLDAYIEDTISWWDVAAGKLIIEKAGGAIDLRAKLEDGGTIPIEHDPTKLVAESRLSIIAGNGKIDLSSLPA